METFCTVRERERKEREREVCLNASLERERERGKGRGLKAVVCGWRERGSERENFNLWIYLQYDIHLSYILKQLLDKGNHWAVTSVKCKHHFTEFSVYSNIVTLSYDAYLKPNQNRIDLLDMNLNGKFALTGNYCIYWLNLRSWFTVFKLISALYCNPQKWHDFLVICIFW